MLRHIEKRDMARLKNQKLPLSAKIDAINQGL
jgi:hypothetical protein